MGLLNRILSVFRTQSYAEGQYREGPYYLPQSGGWLSAEAGRNLNWWQLGYNIESGGCSAMVEACIAAYAQTIAMCPGNHWKWTEKDGRSRVTTSALTRIIRSPNAYQSISDFMLNMIYDMYGGNAYALALRNSRNEVAELHLFNSKKSHAQVSEDGEVFYSLSGNDIIERQLGGIGKPLWVPARDVLHLRLHCPRHYLVGESPMVAAALQMAAGNAALTQQITFYANQARPSFILTTDKILTKEQAGTLRELWNEQAQGLNQGKTPILTGGLKPNTPTTVNANDSQLVELLKMSDQAVANVFRVPLQKLGLGNTTYSSTEALNSDWLASGLGFALNHIEEAFGNLFKLGGQPDEYLEFDTSALLRSSFKERMEGWAAGTQGGIVARNEARKEFELKPVKGGDEPWVQQQDIPLSVAFDNAENPPEPVAPPAPALPAPDPNAPPEPDPAAGAKFIAEYRQHLTEQLDAA